MAENVVRCFPKEARWRRHVGRRLGSRSDLVAFGEKRTPHGRRKLVASDPFRHFPTVNCGIAKGSFVPDVDVSIFRENAVLRDYESYRR